MTLPVPTLMKHDIYALTPEDVKALGVRFLMMDLDNTLSPYHIHEADGRLRSWVAAMGAAGLELFILSNNHGDRPARFARQLGVDYVNRAHKPGTAAALDIPQGTVATRQRRALALLRLELGEEGDR